MQKRASIRFLLLSVAVVCFFLPSGGFAQHPYASGRHGAPPPDFHFRPQDRERFAPHYSGDVHRWQGHPAGRPEFVRGQAIPTTYRIQPVPRAYWSDVPPPPPGYQYGYYGGYVVAYNPTTRIVADALDLAAAAVR